MPRPNRFQIAKQAILLVLTKSDQHIFSKSQLEDVLYKNRTSWGLTQRTSGDEFIDFIIKEGIIRAHTFVSQRYGRQIVRYSFGKASSYALALSMQPRTYLCYATALRLHGLANTNPKQVYLNSEQSPKPALTGSLTQDRIDNAFKGQQRTSNLIYRLGEMSFTIIAGKNTRRLGVEDIRQPDSEKLATTNLERTLIDIAVRPAYAGGVLTVLKAYQAARYRASIDRLIRILKELDYRYPYHQSIGFLMQQAEYPAQQYARLRALGLQHDFYLDYGMRHSTYSSDWRLHYPADLFSE